MDDALTELDAMDSLISSYKIHLNASTPHAIPDDVLRFLAYHRPSVMISHISNPKAAVCKSKLKINVPYLASLRT